MLTLGFEKVAGPIGKAIKTVGSHVGLSGGQKQQLRDQTAKLLTSARKRARRNKQGWSDAGITSAGHLDHEHAYVNLSGVDRKGPLKHWTVDGENAATKRRYSKKREG